MDSIEVASFRLLLMIHEMGNSLEAIRLLLYYYYYIIII